MPTFIHSHTRSYDCSRPTTVEAPLLPRGETMGPWRACVCVCVLGRGHTFNLKGGGGCVREDGGLTRVRRTGLSSECSKQQFRSIKTGTRPRLRPVPFLGGLRTATYPLWDAWLGRCLTLFSGRVGLNAERCDCTLRNPPPSAPPGPSLSHTHPRNHHPDHASEEQPQRL